MSEPTLYRTNCGNEHGDDPPDMHSFACMMLVEPCEHGNYAPHVMIGSIEIDGAYSMCEGEPDE